ncbi:MAG: DUF188 domain-containing protein [Spirochaetaceae bacterium]
MTIWVDADSCPRRIREIVARRANRSRIPARFVSGQDVGVRSAGQVRSIVTEGDADETIVSDSASGDLAVTRDIPLAARLVEKGVVVLNTRGDVYTAENVRERLSERDFAYELRSAAAVSDAARQHGRKEVKAFADAFDRELQKRT